MNERSADPGREAALFLQLVLGLQQTAMMAMGRLINPMTKRIDRDLESARAAIDTLAAIESRTRGQLEPDEARVLAQVLSQLRLDYVEEARKG